MANHLHIIDSFYNNLIAEDRYRMILDGLQVTLIITLGAIILGTLLGGVVCRQVVEEPTALGFRVRLII